MGKFGLRRGGRPPDGKDVTGGHGGTGRAAGTGTGPEADGPAARARRGRQRLLLATALFATLVLPKVVTPPGEADGASARPSPSARSVPAYPTPRPGGSGPAPSSPPRSGLPPGSSLPTPPADAPRPGATDPGMSDDALADAFHSVRAGQCLTVHGNGSGWSRPAPDKATRVPCGDDRAFTRVTAVRRTGPGEAGEGAGPSCPTGNGRATWSHGETALCVTRQFRTGQCLLAESEGGRIRAALMSAPACSTRPPAKGSGTAHPGRSNEADEKGRYDTLLTITGVRDRPAPCRETDDGVHSRYWTWKVDGGSRTLCTADATE